jgi:hypothetical protein
LAEVKVTSQTDAALLKIRTVMAARSLGIKLDKECFDKPTDQQAPCLTEQPDGLVLDDANAQSLVTQLTSGSTVDLMNQLSYSNLAGGGAYSPYVGAILDTVKILASLHTAHFQYIPALALPTKDELNLRLNVPPSFRDPKSVVVVALPPVGPGKPPPLHPVNPAESFCAQRPDLVLPAEGAPIVFSTQLAYGLSLHIETKSGLVELPVKADPSAGGLVLENPAPSMAEGNLTAVLHGKWGFDNWEGPRFHLRAVQPGKWTLAAGDQSALVVGREDTLHLEDDSSLCVDRVEEQIGDRQMPLAWKSPKPEILEVAVPMKDAAPGPVTLRIFQFGLTKPDSLLMTAYTEAASLDRLTLSAGDSVATLRGTRLDEVEKAKVEAIVLTPSVLSRVQDLDELAMNADAATAGLEPGKHYTASVQLRDGRQLKAPVTVESPRPQMTLLSKGTQEVAAETVSPVQLSNPDDVPVEGRFVFFLRSNEPVKFPRDEKVELAATDGSFHTELSLADGSLMLEDSKTAVGNVDPLARFGSSAFGPVEARAISAQGVTGDWLPLGTLVRLPGFMQLHCPRNAAKPCSLTGTNLFLALSIAATNDFENSTDVAPEFTGTQLSVPHPVNGVLYLKLRDDPSTVQTLTMPILPASPAGPQTAQGTQPVAVKTRPAAAAPIAAPAAAGAKP